uniref:CHHC U11-48K-type domain-containing protein n=1 Tax=Falco tinnunculus TaxID=100819 RepID=A0A8C4UYN1_FALTI
AGPTQTRCWRPAALVQCPYDRSHQVRVSRLPYHLVKCQRNNPQVARKLATCPFNASHRVPQGKLQSHIAACPDQRQPDPPHGTDPPSQEDWEAGECPRGAKQCSPPLPCHLKAGISPSHHLLQSWRTWRTPHHSSSMSGRMTCASRVTGRSPQGWGHPLPGCPYLGVPPRGCCPP